MMNKKNGLLSGISLAALLALPLAGCATGSTAAKDDVAETAAAMTLEESAAPAMEAEAAENAEAEEAAEVVAEDAGAAEEGEAGSTDEE